MKERLTLRVHALHQHMHEIEEQINFIERQLAEFAGVGELIAGNLEKEDIEFLAPIGKGIYLKSEAREKSFLVNVGAGVFVRKSRDELGRIIESQIRNMSNIKSELRERHEIFSEEIAKTARELERQKE